MDRPHRKRVPIYIGSLVAVFMGLIGGLSVSTRAFAALVGPIIAIPIENPGDRCPSPCPNELCGGTKGCKCVDEVCEQNP